MHLLGRVDRTVKMRAGFPTFRQTSKLCSDPVQNISHIGALVGLREDQVCVRHMHPPPFAPPKKTSYFLPESVSTPHHLFAARLFFWRRSVPSERMQNIRGRKCQAGLSHSGQTQGNGRAPNFRFARRPWGGGQNCGSFGRAGKRVDRVGPCLTCIL